MSARTRLASSSGMRDLTWHVDFFYCGQILSPDGRRRDYPVEGFLITSLCCHEGTREAPPFVIHSTSRVAPIVVKCLVSLWFQPGLETLPSLLDLTQGNAVNPAVSSREHQAATCSRTERVPFLPHGI